MTPSLGLVLPRVTYGTGVSSNGASLMTTRQGVQCPIYSTELGLEDRRLCLDSNSDTLFPW